MILVKRFSIPAGSAIPAQMSSFFFSLKKDAIVFLEAFDKGGSENYVVFYEDEGPNMVFSSPTEGAETVTPTSDLIIVFDEMIRDTEDNRISQYIQFFQKDTEVDLSQFSILTTSGGFGVNILSCITTSAATHRVVILPGLPFVTGRQLVREIQFSFRTS